MQPTKALPKGGAFPFAPFPDPCYYPGNLVPQQGYRQLFCPAEDIMARTRDRKVITEKDAERKHEASLDFWREIFKTIRLLIIIVGIVLTVYYGVYRSIEVSAGKETTIKYLLQWLTDFNVTAVLGWGVGATFAGISVLQWRKLLKERKEKDGRIKELESIIDPQRTSSDASVSGE